MNHIVRKELLPAAQADGTALPMQLVVVCTITAEDGPQVYANVCAAIEDCCHLTKAEWKAADGVAVFQGMALHPLSWCAAKLYSDGSAGTRVRSIDYRAVSDAPTKQQMHPGHPNAR